MNVEILAISALVSVFSFGMFVMSLFSYRDFKSTKLVFVSIAFFVFFIKGIVQSASVFYESLSALNPSFIIELFDFVILIFLYVATLKK